MVRISVHYAWRLALMTGVAAFTFVAPSSPLSGCPAIALAQSPPASAAANEPKPVKLHILVIEADKKSGDWDKRIADMRSAMPGYKSAKVLDELEASTEEKSSVSLEIMRQSGQPRLLKVSVRKVEADKTVKLRLEIEALKFKMDTTHEKGVGRIVVAKPMPGDKALFFAVTPASP